MTRWTGNVTLCAGFVSREQGETKFSESGYKPIAIAPSLLRENFGLEYRDRSINEYFLT